MTFYQHFKHGISKTRQTKRMILFAWFVNLSLALLLAFPFRNQWDTYVRNTNADERLMQAMDENWLSTYRFDFQNNEVMRLFDYSMFGYAPFFQHAQGILNGSVVRSVGSFFTDLIFGLKVVPSHFGILSLLALLYAVVNSFIGGGFIGMYAREHRSSFTDFLTDGAKHFGRFFRLSLMSVIFYALFFGIVVSWVNSSIQSWTQGDTSEMTPYTYYMVRNVLFAILLATFTMCIDYAKIRIVVDDRMSSILAFFAGFRFGFKNFGKTFGLYLILCVVGFLLMFLYGWLEGQFPQNAYWEILAVMLIQQAYMIGYFWLKANFYASQTSLYQDALQKEQKAAVA
ncbi:MAG: hypothetical protein AABZ41_01345 [Bacteroidota bacterium]